jgi:hypothetical protein
MPPEHRGAQKIGHVQNRTVNAFGSVSPEVSSAGATSSSTDGGGVTATTSPALEPSSTVTIETPKGETISIKE